MSNTVTTASPTLHAATGARPLARSWWASMAVVLAVAAVLWGGRLAGPIDLRYDAGVYYLLGSSLATGQGYRIGSEPGNPEAVQYPPLLPALVAVHQRALGTADLAVVAPALRRTYAVLFAGYAIAVLALARACLPPLLALLVPLLCLAHVNTILYSDMLFTELPFGFVAVAFAWVLITGRLREHPGWREALAGALAAAGFLLRTAGIALLFAWVADAVLRRRWRLAAVRAVIAALPFAGWQAHVWRVTHSQEYTHAAYAYQRAPYQFYNVTYGENLALGNPFRPEFGQATLRTMVRRVGTNLLLLPAALGETITARNGFWRGLVRGPVETDATRWTCGNQFARLPLLLLAALAVVGAVALARMRRWAFVLLLGASVALVCTTPWPQQLARYLSPLAPFLAIAAAAGARAVDAWLRRQPGTPVFRLGQWVLPSLAAVAIATQAYALQILYGPEHRKLASSDTRAAPRWFYFDASWTTWTKAVRWVEQRAGRDDVVVTAAPQLCYLWTGLHAVFPPMETSPRRVLDLMDSVPARWAIVDQFDFLDITQRYARPALLSGADRWRLVHRVGRVEVFERVAAPAPAAAALRE
jgi:hypothetical protein